MGQRGRPRGRQEQSSGGSRHIGAWVVTVLLLAVLGGGGYFVYHTFTNGALASENCTATGADGQSSTIANQRMANAATIAAVARAKSLPERATIIALATAEQESKITNLSGGDRDSVGLFQQRPSQGWGSPTEISDPVFATGSFFHALLNVNNWENIGVGQAAQDVQHSADPSGESYEQWEEMATVLATSLDAKSGTSLTCKYDDPKLAAETPGSSGLTPRASTLGQALVKQFSANGVGAAPKYSHTDDGLTLQIGSSNGLFDPHVLANWAVASAKTLSVDRVQYADQVWTRSSGKWKTATPTNSGTVDVSVVKGG
ncbi:hypothetical protein KGQ20_10375 [Catenulispora sp. NF23]|uniref:Heavy metal transporter n=1 Tax=Catenulispora pinistramenti TaxID=2705254 RepID=A0ABS5KHF1_9ACTN|nr:hypothetical protein [Catenulispora pinistramenti]MBS2533180.1 hypothetical protein [Catenulispora pinistramenti]MBS2545778.1 hypothetical protein [Catenulispora pinistramenti]